jgi:drug/metabolite transporter (DMT)-like permease
LLFSLAIIATLGNYFWTKAISLSSLTNLMPFDFTKLIFSTILGFVYFQEKIDLITSICGIGLIVCNSLVAGKIKNEKI